MRGWAVLLSWAVWCLWPHSAWAQDGEVRRDAAAAEALFQEGRDAMAESDFETACRMFAESLTLDVAVGTVMNLAVCEEQRGHYTAAWERWHQALRLLAPDDDRVLFADQKLEAVAQKLAYLTVRLAPGAPSGLTVHRDGVPLGAASLGQELPADPGKHVVTVEGPRHEKKTYTVSLASGDHRQLTITPGRPKQLEEESAHKSVQLRRIGGYSALGVGVLGAGTALVTGLLLPATDQRVEENCPEQVCNEEGRQAIGQAKTLLALNTAGFVVAGVGLATGTVLLLTLPRKTTAGTPAKDAKAAKAAKDEKKAKQAQLAERSVWVALTGTGLLVQGEF